MAVNRGPLGFAFTMIFSGRFILNLSGALAGWCCCGSIN
jgi:hypothetical protein